MNRQEVIEAELSTLGYRIEPDLSWVDGEGAGVMDLATGELVDPTDPRVIELATEWTLLEFPLMRDNA